MLKTERKQLILEELNQHHVVSLEKLVSLLETSESTVRRDLDELEAENKLRRVHGGAELPHSLQEEETIQEKSVKNLQEKKLLAQKAASLIKEKDVIFIDAGTTTAFTTPDMEEGAVKRAILENAKQTYVLVDSSKIGQTCFAKVAPLKRAIVITSQGHELLQVIKEKTEVIEV
ncbi:TPA: DeoR/GlpR transcriptional regulator [Streptococcus pneumoniae]|nr:DeoR/GlpR transcriptional regulator [Streptococcus pneumoniae]